MALAKVIVDKIEKHRGHCLSFELFTIRQLKSIKKNTSLVLTKSII
jgi:hypothetical protein